MRNVIVSETAEDELRLINEHLSFYSVGTADSFVDAVEDKISMLKEGVVEFPAARDPDLAQAGFHIALVKSYLMLYTVDDGGDVYVAHVFHQSQDYAALVVADR